MNRRRILLILAGILLLGVLAGGAYLLLREGGLTGELDGTLPEIGGEFSPNDATTSTLEEATIPVTGAYAFHATDDGTVMVARGDGTIVRIAPDGASTVLSGTPVANFASASFSADGSKILVLTGQQPRSQVNVFDVAAASWRVIPGSFRDAVWAPSGSLLATLTPDPQTGKTAVALYDTATGRTTQTLAVLSVGDARVMWPARDTVIVADKPHARSTGSAWAIDTTTRRVSLAARGKQGFSALWDPSGSRSLAFFANQNGRGGSLHVMEGLIERASLSFVTLPDKCAFFSLPTVGSSTIPYVMCGVPRDQSEFVRSELPDAWYRSQIYTDDVLVGVNLLTREVEMNVAPPVAADITSIQVVGTTVYYADRVTGALFHAEI